MNQMRISARGEDLLRRESPADILELKDDNNWMKISPEGRNSRFDQAEEESVNSDIELKK